MNEIITFELALSAFVIAMFLIMTWLYPTEEAATDALYKKQVNDYYQHRGESKIPGFKPLHNETLCRGVPEYTLVQGWDSVENAKQTDDDFKDINKGDDDIPF
jgi:hypothetical protein